MPNETINIPVALLNPAQFDVLYALLDNMYQCSADGIDGEADCEKILALMRQATRGKISLNGEEPALVLIKQLFD